MIIITSILLLSLTESTTAYAPIYDENYQIVTTECNSRNTTCFNITEEQIDRFERPTIYRRMELVNGEGYHHTSVELIIPESYIRGRTNTATFPVNKLKVTLRNYKIMIAGGFLAESLSLENHVGQTQNVLNIGLGGGVVCNFFSSSKFEKLKINTTTVELDHFVAEVAKKWFGYEENDRSHTIIDDGIDYVRKVKGTGRKFRTIILDACYNKQEKSLYCPVEGFLQEETIRNMAELLDNGGTLIVNVVLWNNSNTKLHKILTKFTRHFTSCNVLRASDARILICTKNRAITFSKNEQRFMDNLKKIDETFDFNLSKLLQ